MPIFIALFALIALGWGAVHLFRVIAAQFGQPVAIAAAMLAAAILIALVAWWIKRRRDIAPNTKEEGWTHVVHRAWGELRVSATQGLLWLSHDGADGRYAVAARRLPGRTDRRPLASRRACATPCAANGSCR